MARRLVQNELLCLIHNNIQFIEDVSFASSVSRFYKNSDIIDARKQLCKDLKNANCRLYGDNEFYKTKYDKVLDIIKMMKHVFEVNLQHAMPRYCALDLNKIPFLKYTRQNTEPEKEPSFVGQLNERVGKIENLVTRIATKLSNKEIIENASQWNLSSSLPHRQKIPKRPHARSQSKQVAFNHENTGFSNNESKHSKRRRKKRDQSSELLLFTGLAEQKYDFVTSNHLTKELSDSFTKNQIDQFNESLQTNLSLNKAWISFFQPAVDFHLLAADFLAALSWVPGLQSSNRGRHLFYIFKKKKKIVIKNSHEKEP